MSAASCSTLAIDLGGTKMLAALVDGENIIERAQTPTDRSAGPDGWLEQIAALTVDWVGRYTRLGITVTGRIQDGLWSPVNRATLDLPQAYPLAERVKQALGMDPVLANDAQAAAWGEYRYGAWRKQPSLDPAQTMVFLTVSTGIGGGVVAGGTLLTGRQGLTGHFGQLLAYNQPGNDDAPLEDSISGQWMARQAFSAGHDADARGVFEAARAAQVWAQSIIDLSAWRLALLCRNIQLMLDPALIVLGGGIGLADGYLPRVAAHLTHLPFHLRPTLARAALGADAGVIGIAARAHHTKELHS